MIPSPPRSSCPTANTRTRRSFHLGLLALVAVAAAHPALAAKFTGEPEIQARALSPAESLKRLRVEDGLRIELVAAEPLISDPVDVAWDEQGRMYVVENVGYNAPDGTKPTSRIRILEDTDGDGRMDKSTIFSEDLDFAQGVMATKGGVLVTTNTAIVFLRDTDGDGRADVREVLFECAPSIHVDRQISAPRRGIDNWIYFNLGLFKQEIHLPGQAGQKLTLTNNFRYHPVTGEYGPSAGAGQFGKAFDDWGHEFFSMNRNPALFAVMPYRYLQRNPPALLTRTDEDIVPAGGDGKVYPLQTFRTTSSAHAGTFTAACGTGVYRGDLLGREYLNNVFVCEPTGELVSRWILEPLGPSFRGRRAQPGREFLASNDEWFRPVNVTTGPDGALYVIDMYRRFIDGNRFFPDDYVAANNMAAGADRGHIYRIVPATGARPARRTPLPAEPAKRVALLEHPNGWHRDTAQRLLVEAGDPAVLPAVERVLRQSPFAPGRLHALWTLEGLNGLTTEHVALALNDAEPGVVENALWLASRFQSSNDAIRRRVLELTSAPAARVRFAALLAAGDGTGPEATRALVRAGVTETEDAWMRSAILSSRLTQTGGILSALLQDSAFAARGSRSQIELVSGLAVVLAAQGRPAELKPVLAALSGGNAATTGNWWRMALVSGIAEGLRRQTTGMLPKSVAGLLAKPPAELTDSLAGLKAAVDDATRIMQDRSRPISERIAAIAMLEHLPPGTATPLLGRLLHRSEPVEVQKATLEVFDHLNRAAITPVLYATLSEMGSVARNGTIQYLQRSALEMLRRVKAGALSPALIDAMGRWMMLNSPRDDIRALAQDVFGKTEGDRKALIKRYAAAIPQLPASAARGKEIFAQTCAICHVFRGEGKSVGPDITDVRIKTPEMLLSDILDPNNAVDPRFEGYNLQLNDGRAVAGIIASETNDAVVVTSVGGTETIPRASLKSSEPMGGSLMPLGLESSLTEPRMADLLAYLRSDPDAK